MSKGYYRIVLILSLIGASLLTGCGVTSTSLPSNLQRSTGGPLSITTATFPDAITGRSYYLVISTSGGSGTLSSCAVVSGALPTGLTWSINASNFTQCILSTTLSNGVPTGTVAGAAGSYSIVMQATDSSGRTDQLPYTLVVRPDFSVCTGPTSAVTGCSASSTSASTTSFPDSVVNRPYGMSPLSQIVQTNLNTTADVSPVGDKTEAGNGPFTAALTVTGLPAGFTPTLQASQSNWTISSSAVSAAAQTYTVMVSITDNPIIIATQTPPVVPARTLVKTYTLKVDPQIQLAQSLTATWPDAVSGRAYGTGTGCTGTGGNCAPAVYTATNGLGGYVWPASMPAGLAAITGMSCALVTTTYSCSAAKITASPGSAGAASVPYSPSLTVTDTANTATPAATTTTDPQSTRTDALVVDAPLLSTLTQNGSTNPANLLPAVVGRSYGVVGAPPTYTATGGLGAGTAGAADYEWCVKTGTLPTGLTGISTSCSPFATIGAATESLTASAATPIGGTPQTYSFAVELDDTGNASAPSSVVSTTSSVTASTSLVVNPVLAASVTQAGNATPATSLLDGVVNRSYGAVPTTLATAAPPIYTAMGGLPTASGLYLWCVSSGTLPPNLAGISTACGSATSTSAATVQLSASAASPIGGTGTGYTFKVQADDGGNAAVPSTFTTANTDSVVGPTSLTVHPPITLAQSLGASWPDAVNGRAYGGNIAGCYNGTTAVNCASPVYTATGGLATATVGYTWAALGAAGNNLQGLGFNACVLSTATNATDTNTCSAAKIVAGSAIPGAALMTYGSGTGGPTMTVADTANPATPAATATTDPNSARTDAVVVDAPVSFTYDAALSSSPTTSFVDGVAGRDYGVSTDSCPGPANCKPIVYEAKAGLGSYVFTPTGFPNNFNHAESANVRNQDVTSSFSAATINAAAAGAYTPSVSLDDTANTTTPDATSSATAPGAIAGTLTVDPKLTLAQTDGLPSPLPIGVEQRTYGTGAGFTPLQYTATGGLGNAATAGSYVFTPSGLPTNLTCPAPPAPNANVLDCATQGVSVIPTGGAGAYVPKVAVDDLGNAATPTASVSGTQPTAVTDNLTINPPLTLAETDGLPSPLPAGVDLRPYGGSGFTPLQYTASNGLGSAATAGSYVFTPTNLPTNLTCPIPAAPNANLLKCGTQGAGVLPLGTSGTSPYAVTIAVNDVKNQTTPDAVTSSTPPANIVDSLPVNPPLSLAYDAALSSSPTTSFVAGVAGRDYGVNLDACPLNVGGKCLPVVYEAKNGLGTYTFTPSNFPATFNHAESANVRNLDVTSSWSASPISLAAAGSYAPSVSVDDAANQTTPDATASATAPGAVSGTLTVNPKLTLAQTDGLPSPLPAGVEKRTYGTGAGFTPLQYTSAGGLGSATTAGSYVFTPSGLPTNLTCPVPTAPNANVLDCATQGVNVLPTGDAGAYTPKVLVDDVANTAAPTASSSGTQPTAITDSLTIHTPLTLAETDGLPSPLPAGVDGRPYGGSGFTPLQYTASNGLGSATTVGSLVFTPSNLPTNLTCPVPSSPNANVLKCSTQGATVLPAGTSGTSPYGVTIAVDDVKNQTTPDAVASSNGAGERRRFSARPPRPGGDGH